MNENELIENEIEAILGNFKKALDLMNTNVLRQDKNSELKSLAERIVESSKSIDRLLETSEIFGQSEYELDKELSELDKQNAEAQDKFESIKNSMDNIRTNLRSNIDGIVNLKHGNQVLKMEEPLFIEEMKSKNNEMMEQELLDDKENNSARDLLENFDKDSNT